MLLFPVPCPNTTKRGCLKEILGFDISLPAGREHDYSGCSDAAGEKSVQDTSLEAFDTGLLSDRRRGARGGVANRLTNGESRGGDVATGREGREGADLARGLSNVSASLQLR